MSTSSDPERVLVVDDAPDTLVVIKRNLTQRQLRVFTASSVAEALRILEGTQVDLVITDHKMPRASGLDLVRHVRENCEDTEVIMITGYPSVGGAVDAVKHGAEDYLAKPFTDTELFEVVDRVLAKTRLRRATKQQEVPTLRHSTGMLGESAPMRRMYEQIERAATTSATVLVSGESGTGKELVARAIHYGSARQSAPFVPVNCGGIPESLLESELFGHVKGAFSGAVEARAGFFQTADGGSLLLDEVSETPLPMQVKLLRALQDGEVCMVGSGKPCRVDVRILAATNKDLCALVQMGSFREDLYHRLNVINIAVPPLRARGDDIVLLVQHFAAKFAGEAGCQPPRFTDAAWRVLRDHNWPGNVRALENVTQRLVVMNDGEEIDTPDLPSLMRFSAQREGSLSRSLAEVEAEHIRNVLSSVDQNRTRAAEILGIDRKTLREKIRRYGIELP